MQKVGPRVAGAELSGETEFADRAEAGLTLARALGQRSKKSVVVGIPRGGLIVAAKIADQLASPRFSLPIGRVVSPSYPELTLGAVVLDGGGRLVIDEDAVRAVSPLPEYLALETERLLAEHLTARRTGRGSVSPMVEGSSVVLVDDGAASGCTAIAAIEWLAAHGAGSITLALPVAPIEIVSRLAALVEKVVCPLSPVPFGWVGHYYRQFSEPTEDELTAALNGT